jgi:hypothetical protein
MIIFSLFIFCNSGSSETNTITTINSVSLLACLNSVTEANKSVCYHKESTRLAYLNCPSGDQDQCIKGEHKRTLELEEKKIEVLARLNSMYSDKITLNNKINSQNTNTNRNSNSQLVTKSKKEK